MMLPFRNIEGQDSDGSRAGDGRSDDGRTQNYSDSYDTSDSIDDGSIAVPRRKRRQGRRSDGLREDGDVENLLVSSTISRDTTKNTPAADLVDLSKLAALADDLPLNMRDARPPIVMKATGDELAVDERDLSYAISVADSENYQLPPPPPPPPLPLPVNFGRPPPLPPPYPPGRHPYASRPPAVQLPQPPPGPTFHPNSILGKMKPRSNMSILYAGFHSDQAQASYNWRHKLRITGRRKSESDLYGKLDHNSWLSQHLPPTASMRQLVYSWKKAGFDVKKARPGVLAPKDNNEGDLGAALGRTAETYLGLDLYDNNPQSMFFSYLLDTIESLRAERNFLLDLLTKPQEIRPLPPPPSLTPQPTEPNSTAVLTPKVKILHRVFCKSQLHHHDQVVFEDIPVRQFSERSQDLELAGEKLIGNFNFYLSQNPEISFIIFKEYLCFEDPRSSQRKERKGSSSIEISPRAERLRIVSPLLQNALDQVALFPEPEARQRQRDVREMAAPYLFLYHHRELLSKFKAEASGPIKENLALLLSFLELEYGAEYREADMEFSKGILTNKHIEKLLCPNEIIIEKSDGRDMAYVITDWPQMNENDIKVSCWSWHYNGSTLERAPQILRLSLPLPDNCTKDKVSFYPMSMATDATIEDLRRRGKKFWSMKDKYFGCFSGPDESKIQHHHTRVVVDTSTYSRMHNDRAGRLGSENSRFDPWPKTISRDKEPDDSMIMLLPPTVYGFMLQEKKWLKLDVHGIHPIEWNKRAFDRLVLNPKTKELIRALVEIRIAAGRAEDIIGGKGNGLMILLHGGPGTGKTLTAESVAEIAEKPLYRVTCGDIGTKADDVEKYLQTVLYLGKIWNCVLLLDEADIFLEERTIADLERNSLVSVFLRILEYYDGILIMTSNRVGTFDEAFKSRIQVSLHYEDLSKKSRKTIWSNFIAMLEEGEEDVDVSDLESHLDELASEEINGRQIRNAMTTARQLALHRNERLQWEHLEQALKTAREFNQYLKKVQGHTDKQWAREQRLR